MTTRAPIRVLASTLALLTAALLANCGGSSSDSNSGGTTSQTCDPGLTRTCVGPGACEGGQRCSDDGTKWSDCACGTGGTGATAGSGATAGAGNTGGSAGTDASAGGVGGLGGAGGVAGIDSGTDAPADAKPPGPLDDPCPGQAPLVDHIDINCSDQCQATDTAVCAAHATCDIPVGEPPVIKLTGDMPFTIRMPANPGMSCACKSFGPSSGGPQYLFWFLVDGAAVTKDLWIKVDKPWYVRSWAVGATDGCVDDGSGVSSWGAGCTTLFAGLGSRWVGVGTVDPNAPSRTVVVRKAWGTGTGCQDKWN